MFLLEYNRIQAQDGVQGTVTVHSMLSEFNLELLCFQRLGQCSVMMDIPAVRTLYKTQNFLINNRDWDKLLHHSTRIV